MMTVLAMLAAGSALAQPTTPPQQPEARVRVIYRQHETIDFDPTIFDGVRPEPYDKWINVRTPAHFDAMIPERAHFKAELAKSAVDLR